VDAEVSMYGLKPVPFKLRYCAAEGSREDFL